MKIKPKKIIIFFFIVLISFFAKISNLIFFTAVPNHPNNWGVSSGHPLATQVGMDILARGGNAMDAAVAIGYAEGVVEPYACGIGGGGVAIIYENSAKRVSVIDFREVAPRISRIEAENKKFLFGIPGFVSGMELIRKKYGTLSRRELLSPAIRLAEKGIDIDRTLEKLLNYYDGYKVSAKRTPAFYRNQLPIGSGKLLIQKKLAKQMKVIAQNGPAGFYSGLTGIKLKNILKASGCQINEKKGLNYYPVLTSPMIIRYKNLSLIASPSPNGGQTFLEMVKIADINQIFEEPDNFNLLLKTLHSFTICYQDRFNYLGDNHQKNSFILDSSYLKKRWESNLQNEIEQSLEQEEIEESTTHLVVVDRWGNWVSVTLTLGDFFGSGRYVNGFFLNNCMKKFSQNPGSPNSYAPGKRPFSYISPCIIIDNEIGKPILAMGSPGGRQIPAILLQVFKKYFIDQNTLNIAISSPRFYIGDNQTVFFEKLPSNTLQKRLIQNGYHIIENKEPFKYGSVQVLAVAKNGELIGAADPRREAAYQIRKSTDLQTE